MDRISLKEVLEVFNVPLSEEHAWAVCYQCARYLNDSFVDGPPQSGVFTGLDTVLIYKDGLIEGTGSLPVTGTTNIESQLVEYLGLVVYQALDYGLDETEEHKLSPALECLIKNMTGNDEADISNGSEDVDGDEGIENDVDNDSKVAESRMSIEDVLQFCSAHLENPLDAGVHYKAVCRALYAEATELLSFLERIATEKERLKVDDDVDSSEHGHLEELQRGDWARLWIQMMHELRQGVKLRKVDSVNVRHSVEFELTPYEILMEDIRSHRYTLNKVMVNGDIPPRTKKDAHNVMLEFIRSRPPLHPVKDRKLPSPPPTAYDPIEELMNEIRSEPKLRPTPGGVLETSQRNDGDEEGHPKRKVIKANFSLRLSDEEDDLSDSGDDDAFEDKNKVSPSPLSPLTPLSPRSIGDQLPWQQTVSDFDQTSKTRHKVAPLMSEESFERRHSLSVCESPTHPEHAVDPHSHPATKLTSILMNGQPQILQSSLECLSLTVEEVMHIRNVLTKAEVETLLVDPELHDLVDKGKVCFTCRKTKFSFFGNWATKCRFCQRYVCSKCVSKVYIPTEHFEHIPVYTLSPSPEGSVADLPNMPGSVPSSPVKGMFSPIMHSTPQRTGSDPDLARRSSVQTSETSAGPFTKLKELARQGAQLALSNGFADDSHVAEPSTSRPPLQRSVTVARAQAALPGQTMKICSDCKAMIVAIIRASRSCLANAPKLKREKTFNNCPSQKASRDFHLNLKPVYKPTHKK